MMPEVHFRGQVKTNRPESCPEETERRRREGRGRYPKGAGADRQSLKASCLQGVLLRSPFGPRVHLLADRRCPRTPEPRGRSHPLTRISRWPYFRSIQRTLCQLFGVHSQFTTKMLHFFFAHCPPYFPFISPNQRLGIPRHAAYGLFFKLRG